MSSDWSKVRLADCVSILGDGLHGTPIYSDNGDYFFINGNNLKDYKIIIKSDTKRVSKAEYEKYKKPLNDRTLLVSINGTLGNIGSYNGEKVILGKSACFFNVIDSVEKKFIRYVLADKRFQEYIVRFATGTTIKNASLKQMREYLFWLPTLPEQKNIASTLTCIDDKIELNNNINANLEAQAQAIFKSWFVDFEPFQNGEFVESEFGRIPKGWQIGTVGAVAEINKFSYTAKEEWKYINYLDTSSITDNRIEGYQLLVNGVDKIPSRAKRKIQSGDIVYSTVRPNQRHFGFIIDPPENALASTGFAVIRSINPDICTEHIYLSLTTCNAIEKLQQIAETTTSTFPACKPTDITDLPFIIPDENISRMFSDYVQSLFKRINTNNEQSHTLATLRDTLLPKLMSGEIEVPISNKDKIEKQD